MKPDLSGEYVLDRNACALSANASAIVSARLRLTHDDPRFACSARFASAEDAMEFSFERWTDGRVPAPTGSETSRCYWDGDVLVSEDRMGTDDSPVIMIWRYELLEPERRLRATEQMRGGGRDQDNIWIFERS